MRRSGHRPSTDAQEVALLGDQDFVRTTVPASLVPVVKQEDTANTRVDLARRLEHRAALAQAVVALLPVADVAHVMRASRYWRRIAGSERLWALLLYRDLRETRAPSFAAYQELMPSLARCAEQADKSEPYVVMKLLLVGDAGAGKTCFQLRLTEGTFSPQFIATIGIDFRIMLCRSAGKLVKVQLWDTAGQERFRTITRAYYRGAHGVFLMYDQAVRSTFDSVARWAENVREHAQPEVQIMLLACKSDLPAEVTAAEGRTLADSLGMRFLQVSPRTGENVERALALMVKHTLPHSERQAQPRPLETPPALGRMRGCCRSGGHPFCAVL